MERRLAAIMAADVVGYSRLMERDEAGTLERLQDNRRRLVLPQLEKHGGRIVKLMGDGSLVEFASVVAAVNCALAIQQAMAEAAPSGPEEQAIRYRIGINLGDVIVDGTDLYGEGVNVAARLEQLAPPGGVALSQTVRDHVQGRIAASFTDLGEHVVKSEERPIRVYSVWSENQARTGAAPEAGGSRPALSICVLPFTNMSGDPEQEYFSDGITEDIITDLSKVSALFVVSRSTAFTFKGKPVDIGKIARQLRVTHIMEGSVRKAGGRVRITAQLIDGSSDGHIWAERYDRDFSDIFSLQDEISQAIVAALKIKLLPDEKKAITNRSTNDPAAYQSYLMGRHYQTLHGARNLEIAIRFCRRAVEIDANYARAWALIALCQADLHYRGKVEESGLAAAERALAIDPNLSDAYAAKGRVLSELGRFAEAVAAHERSVELEPDSFDVQYYYARTCAHEGRHEAAIVHYERAAELLPTDFLALGLAAQSYLSLGREEEARDRSQQAFARVEETVKRQPDNAQAMFHGAVGLAYLGEKERAKDWAQRALILEPEDLVGQYNIACVYAHLGEVEQALDLLEACLAKMAPEAILWTRNDSDFTCLHGHPRYEALIERGMARLEATR